MILCQILLPQREDGVLPYGHVRGLRARHQATGAELPAFVQNRCFASTRWDAAVRAFCRQQGIIYQGFSLLTANVTELRSARFREVVKRCGRTPAQVVFRFAMQSGILPLTGTSDPTHMQQDLASLQLTLPIEALRAIDPKRPF